MTSSDITELQRRQLPQALLEPPAGTTPPSPSRSDDTVIQARPMPAPLQQHPAAAAAPRARGRGHPAHGIVAGAGGGADEKTRLMPRRPAPDGLAPRLSPSRTTPAPASAPAPAPAPDPIVDIDIADTPDTDEHQQTPDSTDSTDTLDTLERIDPLRGFKRALPILALVIVIALSLRKLAELETGDLPAAAATLAGSTSGNDAAPRPVELRLLAAPAKLGDDLLRHRLIPIHDTEGEPQRLDRLLAHDRITVLNLWATYCKPCKEELPRFATLLDRGDWGERVDLVTVLSQDSASPGYAYRQIADELPPATVRLAEIASSDTTLADGLRELGGIDGSGLPLTAILDCHLRLRLVHHGALDDPDFDVLSGLVATLVGELEGEKCGPRPQPKVSKGTKGAKGTPGTKGAPGTTVTKGDPEPDPADCACPTGERCSLSGGIYQCIPRIEGLD